MNSSPRYTRRNNSKTLHHKSFKEEESYLGLIEKSSSMYFWTQLYIHLFSLILEEEIKHQLSDLSELIEQKAALLQKIDILYDLV